MAANPAQRDTAKIIIPENVSEFYSNNLFALTTPFDFMLLFGSTTLPSSISVESQHIRQDARIDVVVRMSPQQAKNCMRALKKAVENYEAAHGEIHIPPEVPNANPPTT